MKLYDAKPSLPVLSLILKVIPAFKPYHINGLNRGCSIEIMQNEKNQPILLLGRDSLIAINRKDCDRIEVN